MMDTTSSDILFSYQGWLEVTPKLLKHRAQAIPIRNISNVVSFKEPFSFGEAIRDIIAIPVALIILLFVTGLVAGFISNTIGLIVGIVGLIGLVALSWSNLKETFTSHYVVLVEFHDGKDLRIRATESDFAITLRDALHKAIGMN